jgi:release factor glutamine methyltransferase
MTMCETVASLLLAARKALVAADIDGSALDARLLLQSASGLGHEEIVAGPDVEVDEAAAQQFKKFLERRLKHEPISRILGVREFYGREFLVTPAVLDPRPDTEALVELALQLTTPKPVRLLDLGTGTGALAISLLAELPQSTGIAVDLSLAALDVAKHNAAALGFGDRLSFLHSSWFSKLSCSFDLIVSNPPYIVRDEIYSLGEEVRNFDPHLALDGGNDGLDAYRAIAFDVLAFLKPQGLVVLEIGAGQKTDVVQIFAGAGLNLLAQREDLGGHVRALAFGGA